MSIGSIYRVIPGFKIRSKADVKTFIDDVIYKDGQWIIKQSKSEAMIIEKIGGVVYVGWKYGNLSDVFNPVFDVSNVVNEIYSYRKMINNYFFNRE